MGSARVHRPRGRPRHPGKQELRHARLNRGVDLADPEGLLEGTGAGMRHVKIEPKDGPPPKTRVALVRAAAKLDAAE